MVKIAHDIDYYFFFTQCDVFIYVSCAETALLDSKEFLAPVITPFEAMLAFNRYYLQHLFLFLDA